MKIPPTKKATPIIMANTFPMMVNTSYKPSPTRFTKAAPLPFLISWYSSFMERSMLETFIFSPFISSFCLVVLALGTEIHKMLYTIMNIP